jgi:hypothetical protein
MPTQPHSKIPLNYLKNFAVVTGLKNISPSSLSGYSSATSLWEITLFTNPADPYSFHCLYLNRFRIHHYHFRIITFVQYQAIGLGSLIGTPCSRYSEAEICMDEVQDPEIKPPFVNQQCTV